MNNIMVGLCVLLMAPMAVAQEQIPAERAQEAARILAKHQDKLESVQIKIELNTDKPFGLKRGDVGVIVIPDKNLSANKLAGIGKDVIPIGQLWSKGITTVVSNSPLSDEKLRLVKVKAKDEETELSLLLLGARKNADGKIELVVFAQAKEPILVLPLEANERNQDLPIELEGKGEGDRGTLTILLLGKHQAKLPLAPRAN